MHDKGIRKANQKCGFSVQGRFGQKIGILTTLRHNIVAGTFQIQSFLSQPPETNE